MLQHISCNSAGGVVGKIYFEEQPTTKNAAEALRLSFKDFNDDQDVIIFIRIQMFITCSVIVLKIILFLLEEYYYIEIISNKKIYVSANILYFSFSSEMRL